MTPVESALRALGTRLEEEPVPDIAASVAERLAIAPPRAANQMPRQRRRALASSMAILLTATATALASSSAVRDQARSWLRAVGISTSTSPRTIRAPVVSVAGAGSGAPVSPAAAAAQLGVRGLPHPFGPPSGVFATPQAVTLVWAPRRGLPSSAVRGIGALLTIEDTAGAPDPFLLGKVLAAATTVQFASLRGADGGQAVWVAGAPHAVRTYDGHRVRFRLAGNALLWRTGPHVFRLEGPFSRPAALAAARQVIG